MNLPLLFIAGIVFIILGVGLIKHPAFYDSRHQIYQDLTGIEWVVGGAFIAIGLYCLFLIIKSKCGGGYIRLICPKCEEVVDRTKPEEAFCTQCGAKMEKLEGFYERHPELK